MWSQPQSRKKGLALCTPDTSIGVLVFCCVIKCEDRKQLKKKEFTVADGPRRMESVLAGKGAESWQITVGFTRRTQGEEGPGEKEKEGEEEEGGEGETKKCMQQD